MLPSLNLRIQQYLGSSKWIEQTKEVEKFLNLTISLIHPDLFKSGLEMLHKLRVLDSTTEVATEWQSIFTGLSVINNRRSPSHRDSKGRPEWYDLLVNYCGSGGRPRLLLEDIGMDLDYSSGAVVAFCGSVLKHEVKSWGNEERICYAHFMRESVRKRLDVLPAGWVNRSKYFPNLMDIDG